MNSDFRSLPSVDKLLSEARIERLLAEYPRDLVLEVIRDQLDEERLSITEGKPCRAAAEIAGAVHDRLSALLTPALRPVINASGVILHTNLGRAPLSREAIAAMSQVAGSYSNLEFDITTGLRGSRYSHVESLLCRLTGAEAAMVVNNNASAVLLALTALTRRKEVIVSRGQAVEIGGGFRVPDVMRQSGAKLVEVGTTNCTYIKDYESAITPRTAAVMRVHSSNFRVTGFTHMATLDEMIYLVAKYNLPLFDDLGSGCLLDTTRFGLDAEPTPQESIRAGAQLILFSGDKLLGGPQAGIIAGSRELVNKLKKHPLARAIRIDKVRLAALIATLIHYLKGEAEAKIPVWRMISAPLDDIAARAARWAEAMGGIAGVIPGETMVGGGSLPGGTLPTKLVAVGEEGKRKDAYLAQDLSRHLRNQEIPVVGRLSGRVLLLDPRSVLPEEDGVILEVLKAGTALLSGK